MAFSILRSLSFFCHTGIHYNFLSSSEHNIFIKIFTSCAFDNCHFSRFYLKLSISALLADDCSRQRCIASAALRRCLYDRRLFRRGSSFSWSYHSDFCVFVERCSVLRRVLSQLESQKFIIPVLVLCGSAFVWSCKHHRSSGKTPATLCAVGQSSSALYCAKYRAYSLKGW